MIFLSGRYFDLLLCIFFKSVFKPDRADEGLAGGEAKRNPRMDVFFELAPKGRQKWESMRKVL